MSSFLCFHPCMVLLKKLTGRCFQPRGTAHENQSQRVSEWKYYMVHGRHVPYSNLPVTRPLQGNFPTVSVHLVVTAVYRTIPIQHRTTPLRYLLLRSYARNTPSRLLEEANLFILRATECIETFSEAGIISILPFVCTNNLLEE